MAATTTVPEHTVSGQHNHAHNDPAAALLYERPALTRNDRPRSYDPADFTAPSIREMNWKHTPLGLVQTLLDAAAGGGALDVRIPEDAAGAPLAVGQSPRGDAFEPDDLPAALAWVKADEAFHVVVDGEPAEPIMVDIAGDGGVAHAHIVVEAHANAHGTVVLRHTGRTELAENVEIVVGDGAHLELVTLQDWEAGSLHLASHQATVARDGLLRHVVVSFGGRVVRVNPTVHLTGAGARAEMYGISFSTSGQHLESQVFVHHVGPQTTSDVLYKSALQGEDAHTAWVGDVLIGPTASGTDSYEANRNLLLTGGARAESIPNLEIETGDIRGAGHASATGRFDDEQLFYLEARGIPEFQARRLVVLGFLSEVVQRIRIPDLEAGLVARIEEELAREDAAEVSA